MGVRKPGIRFHPRTLSGFFRHRLAEAGPTGFRVSPLQSVPLVSSINSRSKSGCKTTDLEIWLSADLAFDNGSCTKPGGSVEFQDWDCNIKAVDDTLTKDHSLYKWHVFCNSHRTGAGYSTQPGPSLEEWVNDAGFVNVGVHKLPIPHGTWPKDRRYVSGN